MGMDTPSQSRRRWDERLFPRLPHVHDERSIPIIGPITGLDRSGGKVFVAALSDTRSSKSARSRAPGHPNLRKYHRYSRVLAEIKA